MTFRSPILVYSDEDHPYLFDGSDNVIDMLRVTLNKAFTTPEAKK